MIEQLKAQLVQLDKDLKPVLDHVAKAQDRRAGLVKAIEAEEAVASQAAKKATVKPATPVKASSKPTEQTTKG